MRSVSGLLSLRRLDPGLRGVDGDLLAGLGFSNSMPSLIVQWCLGLSETRFKALEFRFADQR